MTTDVAYQIQLWVGADAAATTATVQVAAVTALNLPSLTAEEIDITHMDSPNWLRDYMPGLIDQGQIGVTMNFLASSATDDLLRTMIVGRQIRYWEIRFTVPTTDIVFGGRAFIASYEPGDTLTVGEKTTATMALRCKTLWAEVVA